MQFDFSEDHASIRELARQIFATRTDTTALAAVEKAGGFDEDLWRSLAGSDLLGIAVPESAGGAGMGMLGLAALLEQQGRRVASVPLWATVTTASLPLAEFGSAAQKREWLEHQLDGTRIVTGAFDIGAGSRSVHAVRTHDGGWSLSGELGAVPAAQQAAAVLVPFTTPGGDRAVGIVRTDASGVTRTPVAVTDHSAHADVRLAAVPVAADDVLPADGARIVAWSVRRARVALAALAIGVCSEALAQTAAYLSQRVQFGRPLSTNQAVAVRAADTHLDAEAIRLTTLRAAWLLDSGREEEAEAAALVAKWWAARGGLRAVHATQHLHGGIGADVDFPVHRYFLWGRQIAFTLGSAAAVGAELGAELEKVPMIGASA